MTSGSEPDAPASSPTPETHDDQRTRVSGSPPWREPAESMPSLELGPHFEMHPIVFPAGAIIVLSLVFATVLWNPADVEWAFNWLKDAIGMRFGWLYVLSLTGFLVFSIWLAFGRFGKVKLSKDHEKPEFGRLTWFSMLFSAGMGIGLIFWSVAEPIYHFNTSPPGFQSLDKSRLAMAVTIFHWGLHPWALYAVVALALAYFGFRRGMPLGFRSLLYPIFGNAVWGRLGDAVDTLAIVATLTGVATSLGIGAQQVNAGLAFLFGAPVGIVPQMLLIAGITAIATVSVVLGLDVGIRRLSEMNLGLATLLFLLAVFGGGVMAFAAASVENVGAYLQVLPFSSFRTGAYSEAGQGWVNGWTVFYWAWWIAWSPFVGMFIARVSKGRTIREFVIGVLLVPTGVGILWLTAFGTATLNQHTDHVEQSRLAAEAMAAETDVTEPIDLAAPPPDFEPDAALPVYPVAETDADGNPLPADDAGVIPFEERPLTTVEYFNQPVLNDAHTSVVPGLPTVMFALIDGMFPFKAIALLATGIATLCIVLFFVTSSDSASMVIDIIASGGNPDPPVGTRLFWAVSEGVVAAGLLYAGGLNALQTASITAALPFTFVLLLACVGLVVSLYRHEKKASQPAVPSVSG